MRPSSSRRDRISWVQWGGASRNKRRGAAFCPKFPFRYPLSRNRIKPLHLVLVIFLGGPSIYDVRMRFCHFFTPSSDLCIFFVRQFSAFLYPLPFCVDVVSGRPLIVSLEFRMPDSSPDASADSSKENIRSVGDKLIRKKQKCERGHGKVCLLPFDTARTNVEIPSGRAIFRND